MKKNRPTPTNLALGILSVLVIILLIDQVSFGNRFEYLDSHNQGHFLATAYVALRYLTTIIGALTFGAVLCGTLNGSVQGKLHAVTVFTRRKAFIYSIFWALCASLSLLLSVYNSLGEPFRLDDIFSAIKVVAQTTEEFSAWIVTILIAIFAAVVLRFSGPKHDWENGMWLLSPLFIGIVAVPVTGNAGQGPNHDWATGAMIIATVAVNIWFGFSAVSSQLQQQLSAHRASLLRRRGILLARGTWAVYGVCALIVLLILIPGGRGLFSTWFGALALGIAGVWLLAGLLLWSGRNYVIFPILISGLSVLLDCRPAPNLYQKPSIWQVFLGYQVNGRPTLWRLLFHARFDIVLGSLTILLIILYVLLVIRLQRRLDSWSGYRTTSWIIGCVGSLVFTCGGFNAWGSAQFSVHMTVHMALNMFIPIFLVLGAPVTLILRNFSARSETELPGPREWVLGLVHSRFSLFITGPLASVGIFVISLYGLYFTQVFDVLARYHWGHELMNLHFLITGYLFYWSIIGIDPGPKRINFIGRLGVVFVVMPFHAFFGVATMMMTNIIIGYRFYTQLHVPWIQSLADDQALAGGITWASSEVPIVIVIASLLRQWYKQDKRDALRKDRYADNYDDSEYEKYNAMLQELAQHDN